MRNFNRLKNNKGASMVLVILAMALVTIIIFSFTIQVGNQLKSTTNNQNNIQEKYDDESFIENSIAKFIESINVTYKDDIKKNEKWEEQDQYGNIVVRDKEITYIYYDINYELLNNVDILVTSPKEIRDNPIKIFSHTSLEARFLDISGFHGEKNDTVKFRLEFKEEDGKRTEIIVNISNISGAKDQETYDINYEVISWRS